MSDVISGIDASVIRRARMAKGISLEGLAATLKVTPAKLDALESGRYQDLPDLAFARALAKTVCRYLELDPTAVLATLPSAQPVDLSASDQKGVPFKASKARLNLDVAATVPWQLVFKPQWLVPLGILLAALVVYFWPAETPWIDELVTRWGAPVEAVAVPASAASAVVALPAELAQRNASAAEVASSEALEPLGASAPLAASAPDALVASVAAPAVSASVAALATPLTPVAAPASTGALQLQAAEGSWVEVKDASGAKVLSRHLNAGEIVGVDGRAPLAVKIGNAGGIRLSYQGQPIELAAFTRNNVARLELK